MELLIDHAVQLHQMRSPALAYFRFVAESIHQADVHIRDNVFLIRYGYGNISAGIQ